MNGKGFYNFFALYFKECKKVLLSLTFLLYTAAIFAMYYTQFESEMRGAEIEPKPGLSSYGTVVREAPEVLMPRALDTLVQEYQTNSYVAYPIGFYKEVHLTGKKREKMAEIIGELTGVSREELDNFLEGDKEDDKDNKFEFTVGEEDGLRKDGNNSFVVDGNGNFRAGEPDFAEYPLSEEITYERFRELMRKADDLIGGGSRYSDKYILHNFSQVPKTYEEAMAEYQQFIEEDKITGAYARLYCDYIGMMLSILPVFVAVSLMQLDRKARMEALVYSRRISSAKIISARYAALVSGMFLPVVVTTVAAQKMVMELYPGAKMDLFALARYAIIWMLPAIMAVAAVGMLLTELAGGLLAIFIQGAWWFADVFSGALTGGIGKFNLIIRHNSLYKLDIFQKEYSDFLFNRIFFVVLALLLVALTAMIYEEKRRGRNIGIRALVKNYKNQSAI